MLIYCWYFGFLALFYCRFLHDFYIALLRYLATGKRARKLFNAANPLHWWTAAFKAGRMDFNVFRFYSHALKIDFPSSSSLSDVKCGWDRRHCRLIIFLVVYSERDTLRADSGLIGFVSTLARRELKQFEDYISVSSLTQLQKVSKLAVSLTKNIKKSLSLMVPSVQLPLFPLHLFFSAEEHNFNLNKWNLCFEPERDEKRTITFF